MAEKNNEVIKKGKREVEYLKGDPVVKRMLDLQEKWETDYNLDIDYATLKGIEQGRQEGIERGMEQGIKEGIVQGIEEAKVEIVKEMLKNGISIDLIEQTTKLSKEQIEKILKNL